MYYKISFFLSVLLLSPNLFAQVTHTVSFSAQELTISEVTGDDSTIYTKVEYNGLSNSGEIGNPELPVRYVRLIIPYEKDVTEINLYLSDADSSYKTSRF